MPSKVGTITKVYEDGHVRARDENTGEEWFGRLIIGSGGMVMFGAIDERKVTIADEAVRSETKTRVAVGKKADNND